MRKNNVRTLRLKKGLAQTGLAKLVGTSQQQIQRIERGQVTDLETALSIASALGKPIDQVFPAARKALARARHSVEEKDLPFRQALLAQGRTRQENRALSEDLDAAGIDLSPLTHWVAFHLRGGAAVRYLRVSSHDAERLQDRFVARMRDESTREFFQFETDDRQIVVNPLHVFRLEVGWISGSFVPGKEPRALENELRVYFAHGPEPVEIEVSADDSELGSVESEVRRPIWTTLMLLQSGELDSDFLYFDYDSDSEFLRVDDIGILEVDNALLDGGGPAEADTEEMDASVG